MKFIKVTLKNIVLVFSLFSLQTVLVAEDLSIANTPLYMSTVKPNIMVMLDNSGSMKSKLIPDNKDFNNSTDYYGIFESNKNYLYDSNIPINSNAYSPIDVSGGTAGAFKESNCTPAAGNTTCWSGNFLNWLTTRRIDASRKVLIGGKLESRTAYNYGTDLNYKIVGNNEPNDDQGGGVINVSSSISDDYSPLPNNVSISVSSPAHKGEIKNKYDPYAKIIASSGSNIIESSSGNAIGEFGKVTTERAEVDGSKELKDKSWKTVSLKGSYTIAPVVIAKPAGFDGGDPALVRIKEVTNTSFKISMQEWPYKDGNHTTEDVQYVVIKKGTHVLDGGTILEAGSVDTNNVYIKGNCGSDKDNKKQVDFVTKFSSTPIVIASVMTYNDKPAVNARVWDISDESFKVAMQEEEKDGGSHSSETISYIATTEGTVTDNKWIMEVKKVEDINHQDSVINFDTAFVVTPNMIAATQTKNENDPFSIRLKSISAQSATIAIQEEESCGNDTNHSDEDVGYMAFSGNVSSYNIALVVKEKPIGLLQDIQDKVRLGVSYYRFLPDSNNIYTGEKSDGGTMKFKIPKNPFVAKPTSNSLAAGEKGYRELTGYIGSNIDDVIDSLEHYPLVWGTTPLAENLWEVIQYFEQDSPYYPAVETGFEDFDKADNSNPERDPFYFTSYGKKMECAKSSIILFTDGEPYRDANVPAAVLDFDSDGKSNDEISTNPNDHGKDNLDDVACWAYSKSSKCASLTEGSRDLRNDLNGDQYLRIYTVAFGGGNTPAQILQDTADNAGGKAYAADDGNQLKTALEEAFTAALKDSSSSAASLNSTHLNSDTALFQAKFDSDGWSGKLEATPLNSDLTLGTTVSASIIPAYQDRIIMTHNGTSGVPFQWPNNPLSPASNEINLSQVAQLNDDEDVLKYLRGDASNEERKNGGFRDRTLETKSLSALGDLINSSPLLVANNGMSYYRDSGWAAGVKGGSSSKSENASAYSTYVKSLKNRTPVIYVGANDGMLHGFNATVGKTDSGKEVVAYIPGKIFSKLADLSNPDYSHQYYVDGSPAANDVFYDSAWHTVLVSSLGAGGQGIFALDVTNPGAFNSETTGATKVLWEFTDADDDGDHSDGNIGENGDEDMGYILGKPFIARMANGEWAAIFGNGYNNMKDDGSNKSATGTAVLYIVNIKTGKLIKKIDTGIGYSNSAVSGDYNFKPNGLSSVTPIDDDNDHVVDAIYAGDLYGNLWKFDVDNQNTNNWVVAFSGSPLYTACEGSACTATNRQPITSPPQINYHPEHHGNMVFFGTGKYFENGDNSQLNQTTQAVYGIWDREEDWTAFNRSHLLAQLMQEVDQDFDIDSDGDGSADITKTKTLRGTTNYEIFWHDKTGLPTDADSDGKPDTHFGWYLNLLNIANNNTDNYGERQVVEMILRNEKVIFVTLIPSDDPCKNGGTGWLMELEQKDGSRPEETPFDNDEDGEFDEKDWIDDPWSNDPKDKIPPSSPTEVQGIPTKPAIIKTKDGEAKCTSDSSGKVECIKENPGLKHTGRQSWKQLSF